MWPRPAVRRASLPRAQCEAARVVGADRVRAHRDPPRPPATLGGIRCRASRRPFQSESDGRYYWCAFRGDCDQYIELDEHVYDADLFLDVTILNQSAAPTVLSAIGIHFEEVLEEPGTLGIPTSVKDSAC